jgi:hypothetical protein
MECGGERQAYISHSHDSGHGHLSFNALQRRRKVSGQASAYHLTQILKSSFLLRFLYCNYRDFFLRFFLKM